jgi:hypothetical protein
MKYENVITEDGIYVTCKKHFNQGMRKTQSGFIFCPICKRNQIARARNEILRDICGTSARAAKEDMGI